MTESEIAKSITDAAIEVQRELGGPGLEADLYEEALVEELRSRLLKVERHVPLWVSYKGRSLSKPVELCMRVEGLVLVETTATLERNQNNEAQMLTYLRLAGLKSGLIVNFAEQFVKNGIQRVAIASPEDINFKPQLKRKNPREGLN